MLLELACEMRALYSAQSLDPIIGQGVHKTGN
jgi:hypothetical protein